MPFILPSAVSPAAPPSAPSAATPVPSAKRVGLAATKGEFTRAAILDAAVKLAGVEGFEALTIGGLAERTGLSKSGLFAHFGSKEELQIATLDEAVRRYNEAAFIPALQAPRGLRRLRAFAENWMLWTQRSGLQACPMMSALGEFDDRPGPMRDAICQHMQRLHREIVRAVQMAIDTGEFGPQTDPQQFAFEMFGIVATTYRSRNLFEDPQANARAVKAFSRLVDSCRPASSPRLSPAPSPADR